MPKYKKKPIVVEAFKFEGTAEQHTPDRFSEAEQNQTVRVHWASPSGYLDSECVIKTLEGTMTAYEGDYIIKGVKGELYPCKPDIFEATYELAE
ncbi:hypothetical protein [Endozoicomonas sp. GU-1]|uniref:hypothetical protein n=1 Tax=Endozoicomonas sp. GU-1 TaxID=3009078 RepID=UPI0022B489EC|nr:hypothetical protein [Endozoicomonas sp. GU-1]WBA81926.1 hypothetical protein O2T12_01785 [Endozoicomonas sp. GU-1]WBA84877.1 hypothetical protein O3276_16570 [Endozoicomonas sp. GU-1]